MSKPSYPHNRRWTPFEVAIWLSALLFAIITGILYLTGVVGSLALMILGVIAAIVGLMRYRAEAEQEKRNADDHDE